MYTRRPAIVAASRYARGHLRTAARNATHFHETAASPALTVMQTVPACRTNPLRTTRCQRLLVRLSFARPSHPRQRAVGPRPGQPATPHAASPAAHFCQHASHCIHAHPRASLACFDPLAMAAAPATRTPATPASARQESAGCRPQRMPIAITAACFSTSTPRTSEQFGQHDVHASCQRSPEHGRGMARSNTAAASNGISVLDHQRPRPRRHRLATPPTGLRSPPLRGLLPRSISRRHGGLGRSLRR